MDSQKNKMKKILILCLALFFATKSYSRICKDFTLSKVFTVSDFILIGEIIERRDDYFKVRIAEVFKGTLHEQDTIRIKNDSDYSISDIGEKWLFYLKQVDKNTIQMVGCGWSREFYNNTEVYFIPPPPPHSIYDSTLPDKFIDYLLKGDTKIYEVLNYFKFNQEVINLRALKNQKRVESLEASNKRLKSYFFISSIVFSALFLFVFFRHSKTTV